MRYLWKMIPFVTLMLMSAACWATLANQSVAAQETDSVRRSRSPRQVAQDVMSSLLGTPVPTTGDSPRPGTEFLVRQSTCAGPAALPQSRPRQRHLALIPAGLRCLNQSYSHDICLCPSSHPKIGP